MKFRDIVEAKEHPAYKELMDLAKKMNNRDTRAVQVLAGKISNFTVTGNRGMMADMVKAMKSLDDESHAAVMAVLNKHDKALAKSIHFKMGMNESEESLTEAVEGINSTGIGYVIPYTLQFIAQAHAWHLVCPNGQKHTALGELYERLQDEVDGLAEKFIAHGGVLQMVNEPIIAQYDEETVRRRIEEFRNIVSSAINTDPAMASIVDGVVDLQEVIDESLYKFNLS